MLGEGGVSDLEGSLCPGVQDCGCLAKSSDCDGLGKAGREGDPAGVGDLGGTKLLPSGGSACLDDGIRCPGS